MKFLWVTGLSIFVICSVNAQVGERLIQRNVKRSGWVSPIFATQVSEVKTAKTLMIDGITVQVKIHKLAGERLVYVEGCNPKADEEAIRKGNRRNYVVRDYKTYAVKGRVFAYDVAYYLVRAENGYVTERYLAARGVKYVDENGDGKFEILCDAMGQMTLPRWIKARTVKR